MLKRRRMPLIDSIVLLNFATLALCCAGVVFSLWSIYLGRTLQREADRYAAALQAAAVTVTTERATAAAARQEAATARAEQERLGRLNDALSAKLRTLEEAPSPGAPPRALRPDERAKIVTFLNGFSNRLSVTVAILADPESQAYGAQIVDALTAGGARVLANRVASFAIANAPNDLLYGIRYTAKCPEPIRQALDEAGLAPLATTMTPNRADLYIGMNRPRS